MVTHHSRNNSKKQNTSTLVVAMKGVQQVILQHAKSLSTMGWFGNEAFGFCLDFGFRCASVDDEDGALSIAGVGLIMCCLESVSDSGGGGGEGAGRNMEVIDGSLQIVGGGDSPKKRASGGNEPLFKGAFAMLERVSKLKFDCEDVTTLLTDKIDYIYKICGANELVSTREGEADSELLCR